MSKLTGSQLSTLREMLTEAKNQLEKHFEINQQTGEGMDESLRASTSELSSVDNHPADIGTEVFERERDLAVNETLDDQLDDINHALNKMNDGGFGVCEVCGSDIPYERLEALPYTPYCVEHAEHSGGVTHGRAGEEQMRRPVEEQVMTKPPAGAGQNRQNHAGRFDDADAWKTVESYGTSNSPAMEADSEVTDYDSMSSDKLDSTGHVEELEKFAANDIRGSGKNRHVQQTKPYREYVSREEGEILSASSDADTKEQNRPPRGG